MEIILAANSQVFSTNCEDDCEEDESRTCNIDCIEDCNDYCRCDPYEMGCTDEDCMGDGESCIGDCRQGA